MFFFKAVNKFIGIPYKNNAIFVCAGLSRSGHDE